MNQILEKIQKIGIVPVVVLEDAKDALPLAKALIDGGLPLAEVTFRTLAAEESIKHMTHAYPEMLVGAGTVLTIENAKKAIAAGAKFIVSPGFDEEIVRYCIDQGIPVTPGATSPTEVGAIVKMGLDVVKFFPAEPSGGLSMIKAIAAPFTNVKFMPTGGVSAENINEYLSYDKILACGGSWMVKGDLIQKGDFEQIKALTKEAVMTMLGFELSQEGYESFLGLGEKKANITLMTNSVERAVYYLETKGVQFNQESAQYKKDKLVSICTQNENGGCAVCLAQK